MKGFWAEAILNKTVRQQPNDPRVLGEIGSIEIGEAGVYGKKNKSNWIRAGTCARVR